MNNIPEGWKAVRLEEVCEINPREPGPGNNSQLVSFVPMPAVSDEAGEILEHQTRPFEEVSKGYTRFRDGDVIFAKITPCMENGKIAVATGLHNQLACGSTEFHVLRSRGNVLPKYVWRFLRQASFREEAGRHMTGAVGQRRVPAQYLKDALIPLPPLDEQRRIVARLDALLARSKRARAELARVPGLVERQKQAVLAAAFSGELTREWRQSTEVLKTVASQLTTVRQRRLLDRKLSTRKRFTSAPDIDLPLNWLWISPDEIASDEPYSIGIGPFGSNLVRGDYREEGVRLIFVRDIRQDVFNLFDAKFITPEKARELHQHVAIGGDVLITKMGEPPGDTALYPRNAQPAVITADCIKLRPELTLAISEYLVYCIKSDVVRRQMVEITAGIAQQKVSLERFRQIALPIPSIQEQNEIVRCIESAFAHIDRTAAEAERAAALLDRLDQTTLAKAFQGEL